MMAAIFHVYIVEREEESKLREGHKISVSQTTPLRRGGVFGVRESQMRQRQCHVQEDDCRTEQDGTKEGRRNVRVKVGMDGILQDMKHLF